MAVTVVPAFPLAVAVIVTVAPLRIDGVSVTVLPDAAGQVDEPAIVTVLTCPVAAEAGGQVDEPAIVTVVVCALAAEATGQVDEPATVTVAVALEPGAVTVTVP